MKLHNATGLLFTLLCMLFISQARAQEGRLTGRVVDSLSGTAIDYASVGLMAEGTDKEINGATTDDKGVFMIDHIAAGRYRVVVYYIGYKNASLGEVEVRKGETKDIGAIRLASAQTMLKEVTVVATAPVVENKVDKIVYNAENDVTSQGGAAIDILRKVPQVSVDIDGNVELQGNPNVRFLINGKPSSIFGSSLADALASIPASQIKSIEVIASPGAKYDAQGTGGIINIILKESKVKGINGNVNASAGTRFETGSVNINARNGNIGVNAFASGNAQLRSYTPNSQDRTSFDAASQTTTQLLQNGYTNMQRNGYRGGLGFDWSLNKYNSLTGSVAYNRFANQNSGYTDQEQIARNAVSVLSDMASSRSSTSASDMQSVDCNLSYRKSFKKEGQELNVLYASSYGIPHSHYTQSQSYAGSGSPYTGVSGNNPGTDNQVNISIDYTQPVREHLSFETGVKHVIQQIHAINDVSTLNTESGTYEPDPLQSFSLSYHMKVYAGYLSSDFRLFKWLDVRAGARIEHTDLSIDFPGTSIPSYNTFVPSLIFSHQFKKDQVLKLSYARRLERPEYGQLNPFLNLSDPRNIASGNPGLRPEIANNMELAYSRNFSNGGNVYIAAIERINTQDVKQITVFYPSYTINDSAYANVSISRPQNIGMEYNSGGSLSGTMPLTERMTLRGNFMAMHRYIVSNTDLGSFSMGMRYRLNLNLSYRLPKDLVIEAFGNYGSPARNIQGKTPQQITYNLALRKQFWNRKASLGLTATNPFNKYVRQETTVTAGNYSSVSMRMLPYRSFGISFTCKFGRLEAKKIKEETNEFLNGPPAGN